MRILLRNIPFCFVFCWLCSTCQTAFAQDGTFVIKKNPAPVTDSVITEVLYSTPDSSPFIPSISVGGAPINDKPKRERRPIREEEKDEPSESQELTRHPDMNITERLSGIYKAQQAISVLDTAVAIEGRNEYLKFYPDGKVYYVVSSKSPVQIERQLDKTSPNIERIKGQYSFEGDKLVVDFNGYIKTKEYDLQFNGERAAGFSFALNRIVVVDETTQALQQTYTLCRHSEGGTE